ncbi:hypothetical protein [Kitasatospora fiedleri]|uniref:hypothetical protein n=1 Tax=Kitasatospora fiedleri TaxID=2991545 RepID=UPI00249B58DF|nr:hypothetical protein [Kitasatospora fiedleri]
MTARRLPLLALGALLATALLTGCGIRPTAVPVDAGAPASRTACPNEVTVPLAPDSASPIPSPSSPPKPSPTPTTAATTSPSALAPASPTTGGVFGAPSPNHCP